MHTPGRGDGALRRHRVSLQGASYFLTLCTVDRSPGLNREAVASAIQVQCAAIETDGHWTHRAGVIMQDHLHLFVCLKGGLSISRCVARLKSKTRVPLSADGITWQPNFYEHRLRPEDAAEDVLRYIFMNPYLEKIVPCDRVYPWYWLGNNEAEWFHPQTDHGMPLPEWLRDL
jgi:REP element-mobilizing transposase RayT